MGDTERTSKQQEDLQELQTHQRRSRSGVKGDGEMRTLDEAKNEQKNMSFVNLVKKNPTLPIVPMVDAEIVCDNSGYWMGSFGHAAVGEYALYDERFFDDREDFKTRYFDRNDDDLCEKFGYEPYISEFSVKQGRHTQEQLEANEANEKRLEEYLDKIAEETFTKAIIVYIDLPE